MKKEECKICKFVEYTGLDSTNDWSSDKYEKIEKTWIGVIVGIGNKGITVEFDETFEGHYGDMFPEANGKAISMNEHHWYFDFEPDSSYEKSFTIDILKLV